MLALRKLLPVGILPASIFLLALSQAFPFLASTGFQLTASARFAPTDPEPKQTSVLAANIQIQSAPTEPTETVLVTLTNISHRKVQSFAGLLICVALKPIKEEFSWAAPHEPAAMGHYGKIQVVRRFKDNRIVSCEAQIKSVEFLDNMESM